MHQIGDSGPEVRDYADLLRAIATITWRTDPDGRARKLPEWEEYTGMPEGGSAGQGWLDAVHPEDRESTALAWAAARDAGERYRTQYRIRDRDGQYRWFDVHGIPIHDDAGAIREWVGACIDIHDRVSSEERARRVLDNMSEAFVTIDRDFRLTFQNREGARLNRKAPEAIYGKTLFEEWPEIAGSALEENYRTAMREQREVRFTHRYHDPGEYDLWLEITAVPDDEGGLGIFYLDITERKAVEGEVIERERRFKELSDHLKAAFLLTSPETGRIEYISSHAEQLWGRPVEELMQNPALLREGVTFEDPDVRAASVWDAPSEGESQTDYLIRALDGTERWVSHRSSTIEANETHGERVGHIVTDITDRRRLELELRRSQQAEALGKLAGGVAHDFNNLLTVFLAHLVRIEDLADGLGAEGESILAEVHGMESAVGRATQITRQILTFARKPEGETRLLTLNQTVRDAEGMMRRLIGEGRELSIVLDPTVGSVRFDPVEMDRILLNLVANAHAATESEGTIMVSTTRVEVSDAAPVADLRAGNYVRLSCSDDGVGIPSENLDRVFDAFFTTRESQGGTGLGLATIHGAVRQQAGAVTVESELGRGSTFHIYLPDQGESSGPSAVSTEVLPVRGTERLLVVEDEPQLRDALRRGLSALGYEPDVYAGMPDVLAALGDEPRWELVLTDVVMPGGSGIQLAGELLRAHPELPILVMSGYRRGESIPPSRTPEELAFIAKPFTIRELAVRIRQILDRLATS